MEQGDSLVKQGKFAEAITAYDRTVGLAEQTFGANSKYTAAMLYKLANAYESAGRYVEAEAPFRKSLAIYEAIAMPDAIAEALNNLANVCEKLEKFDECLTLYRRALTLFEARFGQDSPQVASALNNLAIIHVHLMQYDQAESLLRRSLAIAQQKLGPDHVIVATTLNSLADLKLRRGEYADALALQQQSVSIIEKRFGPDHVEVARSLNNLGAIYDSMGQYDQAKAVQERELKIFNAKLDKNHPDVARVLQNLAITCQRLKDYKQAETLYQRCLGIKEATYGKDHLEVALVLHNLAALYSATGQYPQAHACYERSLQIREAKLVKNDPDLAHSLESIGWLRIRQQDFAAAEECYQRSLAILQAGLGSNHPDLVGSLTGLAWIHGSRDRWDEAAAEFDKARRIVRRHVAQVLPSLSEKEQLAFLENRDRANFYIALSLSQTKTNAAAFAARTATWLLNGKAMAQETLVQRAALGRDSADPHFAAVVKQLTAVRSQLANLTNAAPKPGREAARQAELANLSTQEQDLARQLSRAGGSLAPAPWIELDAIRAAIPKRGVLVDILRYEPRPFVAEALDKASYPAHYSAWITPPAGAGDVQVLDLGDADAIDATISQFQTALKRCQNPDKTQNPLIALGEPEAEKELQQALAEISKRVLQPLLPHLQEKEELILSPDAALWLVPWAALTIEEGKYAVEKWNIHYLISARDLVAERPRRTSNAPRIFANPNYDLPAEEIPRALGSVFGGRAPAPSPTAQPGTVAADGFDHNVRSASLIGRVPLLAGTASEAKAISPNLQKYAGDPKLYSEDQALEGVFKRLASPRVLVISTHGFFLPDQQSKADAHDRLTLSGNDPRKGPLVDQDGKQLENPLLRCGLLLAGCNNRDKILDRTLDDGILTGMEIVGTDLRGTELVVLSACETGLGKVQNGEGVAGLRQAFQLAGASAVVATLWQIPDQATALLMNDFFANLAAGQSKADALRNAQLSRIKARRDKYGAAHPLFWAAFTLTGQ